MRPVLILTALAAATPALAAPQPQQAQAQPSQAEPQLPAPGPVAPRSAAPGPVAPIAIPPELSDPALADRLGRMTGSLAKAMMDLPIGEFEAAIENRPVTPADRNRKVRDVAAVDDPQFEQRIAAEAAGSGRMMQSMSKALIASVPAMMRAMAGVQAEIARAVANIPDPTYPRR